MCVSPLKLRNKYNYFRRRFTSLGEVELAPSGRSYIQVPCGHCWQCYQNKVDSMVFRCISEYKACDENALFLTLTYSDRYLPRHPYNSDGSPISAFRSAENPIVRVPVWNKTHVQKFLKSLNEKAIYLLGKKKGLTRLSSRRITPEWKEFVSSSPRPFSYICSCERGSFDTYVSESGKVRTGTGRPHYHIILFVRRGVDLTSSEVQSLALDTWKYGTLYPLKIRNNKKNHFREWDRDSYSCIRYVCKYIVKGSSFDYKDVKLRNLVFSSHEQKLNCLPFFLTSNFLGLDWFLSSDFKENYKHYLESGITVPIGEGKTRQINVPHYYLNRVRFLTCREIERFYHTDFATISGSSFEYRTFGKIDKFVEKQKQIEVGNPLTECVQRYATITEIENNLRVVNIPTLAYYDILNFTLKQKCKFYCEELRKMQSYYPLWVELTLVKHPDVLARYEFLKCRLNSVSLDEFYDFIHDELYCFDYSSAISNIYESQDYMTSLFEFLTDFKNILNTKAYEEKQLKYRSNLSDSILEKPQLFNVKPLKNEQNHSC